MIIRSLGGQFTFGLYNFAITLIALGTVSIIFNTNPFWITILACIVNRERVQTIEIIGIVISFTGILIVGYSEHENHGALEEGDSVVVADDLSRILVGEETEEDETPFNRTLGVVLSICAAWAFAVAAVYNRKLKDIPVSVVMFYHGLIGMIAAGLYLVVETIYLREFRTYTWKVFGLMTISMILDTLACNLMTMAYQLDTSGFMSLLFYISIVYSYLMDIFIFHEQIDALEICGVLIIFVTTITVATIKVKKSMDEAKTNVVEVDDEKEKEKSD